jgi:phospholipase C
LNAKDSHLTRRSLLQAAAQAMPAAGLLPGWLREALAIEPQGQKGTIADVAHIVVLTQENRSFDHYFGAMRGVRGFGDRFTVPALKEKPRPFHLDTTRHFELMRAEGTAHTWVDAQLAWNHGSMGQWTRFKGAHSVGYYAQADLPFHYALADAFTVCDAYHCSFHGGTNPNRLFLWTGTNDPQGTGNGPATYNDLDSLKVKPGVNSYTWTTYPERLQTAGISWQVYQDMADNYDDNPLAGFQAYRDAAVGVPGSNAELKRCALSTRTLAQLRADVQANQLPQVSWIIAPAKDSEHPEMSSPAQGAHFAAQVLQALTSNPEVWSRTVLFLNFDENDGYFDHVPPPAVPSCVQWSEDPSRRVYAGASTVDTRGEYHEQIKSYHKLAQEQEFLHRPYGLGPRVPMLVISPWSRGGWVNSQVFDHTSIIRFMELRFGVQEPNISAWRRAVCGDLSSVFDFAKTDAAPSPGLPDTQALAERAAALPGRVMPGIPGHSQVPTQSRGTRPSRALPYVLNVRSLVDLATGSFALIYENAGTAAAVFHEYDRLHPTSIPKRYTIEAGRHLVEFPGGYQDDFDLWVLGPNGFHRHFTGKPHDPINAHASYQPAQRRLGLQISNTGKSICTAQIRSQYANVSNQTVELPVGQSSMLTFDIAASHCWYDLTLTIPQIPGFLRRFAGRMETGAHSTSSPA